MGVGKTVETDKQALASDINSMCQWGTFAARPATEDVLAGSFYMTTDTKVLYQEQNGAWVAILQIQTLNPANETVNAGYYAATTLSAVDADLAIGNIKKDVNIFGKVGTYDLPLSEDIKSVAQSAGTQDQSSSTTIYRKLHVMATGTDLDIVSLTQTYDAASMAVAVGVVYFYDTGSNYIKMRLFMNGTQVGETGYVVGRTSESLIATRALSGANIICKVTSHNYHVGDANCHIMCEGSGTNEEIAWIGVGSIKKA